MCYTSLNKNVREIYCLATTNDPEENCKNTGGFYWKTTADVNFTDKMSSA